MGHAEGQGRVAGLDRIEDRTGGERHGLERAGLQDIPVHIQRRPGASEDDGRRGHVCRQVQLRGRMGHRICKRAGLGRARIGHIARLAGQFEIRAR